MLEGSPLLKLRFRSEIDPTVLCLCQRHTLSCKMLITCLHQKIFSDEDFDAFTQVSSQLFFPVAKMPAARSVPQFSVAKLLD
jgi:hypothetical protein